MTVIYDRDPGDGIIPTLCVIDERHRHRDAREPTPSTGMCSLCRENEALPNDCLCDGCLLELELAWRENDDD